MIYIETRRLILRDWKDSDLGIFQQMNADLATMEFFPNTLSFDESEVLYEKIKRELTEFNYGLYAVEIKESKQFIGFTGFHYSVMNVCFSPCVEIAWRYLREAWGYGYATEAASACLDYAKENLNFEEVYSFTSLLNKRSENVMRKLNMKKMHNFMHPAVENGHRLQEHVLYKIVF